MPEATKSLYHNGERYSDAISKAVHAYLRTGMLPPTDIDVAAPGPDEGPGRGMTGTITSSDIKHFAKRWYIGCDGEMYHESEGPGPVRYDGPERTNIGQKVKSMVAAPPKDAFHDWND